MRCRKGFANGSIAGLTGAIFGCPFNVVKVRVQDYRAQQLAHFPGGMAVPGNQPALLANRGILHTVLRDVFVVEHSYFRGLPVALGYTIPAARYHTCLRERRVF